MSHIDLTRVLKAFKFHKMPTMSHDYPEHDEWESPDARVDVIAQQTGRWTIEGDAGTKKGSGAVALAQALKTVLPQQGRTNETGVTEATTGSTPQDIARILTKLQLSRRPDIDDDGMESWVDQKGRGNVEVSVSESGRWVIIWEDIRIIGFGLGQLAKKLIDIVRKKQQTNEGLTAEELDELTGTGGIAGFGTPYAFAGNDEDKKKVNEAFESLMEGTRSTSDEYEKMLKQAGYKNLGAGAGSSDEWEKSYKTGTKTIFVNINGWNVNGGPQGDTVWQLKRYLASKEGASWQKGVNEGYDKKDGNLTPPDMARLLKKNGFFNTGGHYGVDIWDDDNLDVEVQKNGSWSIFGDPRGSTVGDPKSLNGKGAASLTKALKNLSEGGDPYYGWRNDESQTPRQKIGNAITEINKQLREVERVVKRTQRLKKETGTSNNALWNRTNKALMKIEGRMHRISQTIRNMRG